jgi:hypothetical protein
MTILFDATAKVNRVNRLFGLGLGVNRPRRPYNGPSEADRAWAAQHLNDGTTIHDDRLDAEVDRMAEEAAWQDAYEAGIALV